MKLETALLLISDLKTGFGLTRMKGTAKVGWRFWFDDGSIASLRRSSRGDYVFCKEVAGKIAKWR